MCGLTLLAHNIRVLTFGTLLRFDYTKLLGRMLRIPIVKIGRILILAVLTITLIAIGPKVLRRLLDNVLLCNLTCPLLLHQGHLHFCLNNFVIGRLHLLVIILIAQ